MKAIYPRPSGLEKQKTLAEKNRRGRKGNKLRRSFSIEENWRSSSGPSEGESKDLDTKDTRGSEKRGRNRDGQRRKQIVNRRKKRRFRKREPPTKVSPRGIKKPHHRSKTVTRKSRPPREKAGRYRSAGSVP